MNNTQIFARLSGTSTQFLAYQMNYESREQNAMILPLPVKQPANAETLNFINLKEYEAFFDDLSDGFPFHSPPSIGCSAPFDPTSRHELEVVEVGNYIASFVPTIADFDRLDSQFTLPNEIWASIPEYKNFGFAVFQLAAGLLKPHPMAFEFQSATDDLFFPTVHIHDGEVHDSEDFDHVLYMQHAGLDSKVYAYENSYVEDQSTGLIRSKYVASHFCNLDKTAEIIDENLLVHRKIMRGNLINSDTIFAIAGDPLNPSLNFRPWLSFTPWLIVLAGIGWFFNRRAKLKKLRETKPAQYDSEGAT
ncbi:hypothetical protein [Novipirellula aureliae]|uniref:hypothetical protein n=1 Tax=Novipirellula aureliae TaxID=2527966 RepID=UPI0011B79812|nr:hypothetical protein [Novipirellula aureliae]